MTAELQELHPEVNLQVIKNHNSNVIVYRMGSCVAAAVV